jgi:CBS domain-containing protein
MLRVEDVGQRRGSPRPVGIFTQQTLAEVVAEGLDLDSEAVADHLIPSPTTIDAGATLAEAGVRLTESGMRQLIVTERVPRPRRLSPAPWI